MNPFFFSFRQKKVVLLLFRNEKLFAVDVIVDEVYV